MYGLYEALGRVVSAAHANGDKVDENTFPTDESYDKHGLDVFHNGILLRFRNVPEEPRFTVDAPVLFAPRLRNRYTPEELSKRGEVVFEELTESEQEEVRKRILRADLREAEQYEDEFQERIREDLSESRPEILRLGYGDEELWNGVLIRDRLFPYEDAFSVERYRETVAGIKNVHRKISDIVSDIPPINGKQTRNRMRQSTARAVEGPSGFQ